MSEELEDFCARDMAPAARTAAVTWLLTSATTHALTPKTSAPPAQTSWLSSAVLEAPAVEAPPAAPSLLPATWDDAACLDECAVEDAVSTEYSPVDRLTDMWAAELNWEREDADIVGAWVEETGKAFTTEPQGDPLQVAKNVYWKYKEAIKSSPILGEPEYIREDEEAKAKAAMWLAQSEKSETEEVEVVHRKKNKRVTAKEMISRLEKTERRRHEGYLDAEQELLMEDKSDVSGSDVMRVMRSIDSTVWVVVSGVCATVFIACVASHRASKLDARPYERYDSYPHDERRPLLG